MPRVKRTLPIASAGGQPKFNINDADWRRIESAYGRELPSKLRQHIFEVTTSLVYFEVFERTVEPLSWATDRIQRVKKGAQQLYRAILQDPHHASDAYVYANHMINEHFKELNLTDGDRLQHLCETVTCAIIACNQALKEVGDPNLPDHREGECWKRWIRGLTKALNDHGLPTAARKDSDKM